MDCTITTSLVFPRQYYKQIWNPSNAEIFDIVKELRSNCGTVEMYGDREFSIYAGANSAEESRYLVLVEGFLLIDSRIQVPSSSEDFEFLGMGVGESVEHDTVSDFDQVLLVLENYIASDDHTSDKHFSDENIDPYSWLGINSESYQTRSSY